MTPAYEQEQRRIRIRVATIALIPALYALSSGPVVALAGLISDGVCDFALMLYEPLSMVAVKLDLCEAYFSYVAWWIILLNS